VLEALLQVAALAVHLGGGPTQAAWLTGNRRVLCLGDSNTYGLYLADRAQAYPQTFEALWNERVVSPRIEVLNLGYPGTNSSRLRRDLPRMLETFAPDVVVLMAYDPRVNGGAAGTARFGGVEIPVGYEKPHRSRRAIASVSTRTCR
jgi:hypothetical protein